MEFFCLGCFFKQTAARVKEFLKRSIRLLVVQYRKSRRFTTSQRSRQIAVKHQSDIETMFNTLVFLQSRQEQNPELAVEPFGSEIFQMMAASTAGLAFGGPDRMLIKQPKSRIALKKTGDTSPPVSEEAGVRAWLMYDPQTEDFRQLSVDERKEEEQIAAQTLVEACEEALDAASTTAISEEQGQEAGLLRSSFSFAVSKESCASSPSASPFSGRRKIANPIPPVTIMSDGYGGGSRSDGRKKSSTIVNGSGDFSPTTSSSSSSSSTLNDCNYDNHVTPSLKDFPSIRETRLGSHRGSVMEAGVVLDSRIFGGIGIVQDGRKVGVRRSEGVLRLQAVVGGRE